MVAAERKTHSVFDVLLRPGMKGDLYFMGGHLFYDYDFCSSFLRQAPSGGVERSASAAEVLKKKDHRVERKWCG